jgi:hypothetical protein
MLFGVEAAEQLLNSLEKRMSACRRPLSGRTGFATWVGPLGLRLRDRLTAIGESLYCFGACCLQGASYEAGRVVW